MLQSKTSLYLGEIDDQRKKVESSHSKLLQAHSNLLKTNSQNILEQQRMKNNMNRLQQSASRATDGEGLAIIKNALK